MFCAEIGHSNKRSTCIIRVILNLHLSISNLFTIMKVTTTILLLYIARGAQGQGSCGPGCCRQKVVNNTRYVLSHESKDLPSSCQDGCVYRMENGPKENLYCFSKGEFPVQECINCKALPGIVMNVFSLKLFNFSKIRSSKKVLPALSTLLAQCRRCKDFLRKYWWS